MLKHIKVQVSINLTFSGDLAFINTIFFNMEFVTLFDTKV